MYNCMPTFHGKTYQVILQIYRQNIKIQTSIMSHIKWYQIWAFLTWKPTLWIPFFLHNYFQPRLPSYDFRVPRWRPGRYVRERVRFPMRRCHAGGGRKPRPLPRKTLGFRGLFEKMQMGTPMMAKVVLFVFLLVFEGLKAGNKLESAP